MTWSLFSPWIPCAKYYLGESPLADFADPVTVVNLYFRQEPGSVYLDGLPSVQVERMPRCHRRHAVTGIECEHHVLGVVQIDRQEVVIAVGRSVVVRADVKQ